MQYRQEPDEDDIHNEHRSITHNKCTNLFVCLLFVCLYVCLMGFQDASPTNLFVLLCGVLRPAPAAVLRTLRLVLLHDQRVRPQVHVEVEHGRTR